MSQSYYKDNDTKILIWPIGIKRFSTEQMIYIRIKNYKGYINISKYIFNYKLIFTLSFVIVLNLFDELNHIY